MNNTPESLLEADSYKSHMLEDKLDRNSTEEKCLEVFKKYLALYFENKVGVDFLNCLIDDIRYRIITPTRFIDVKFSLILEESEDLHYYKKFFDLHKTKVAEIEGKLLSYLRDIEPRGTKPVRC